MLKKPENRLFTRAARKRSYVFAGGYRTATVTERGPDSLLEVDLLLLCAAGIPAGAVAEVGEQRIDAGDRLRVRGQELDSVVLFGDRVVALDGERAKRIAIAGDSEARGQVVTDVHDANRNNQTNEDASRQLHPTVQAPATFAIDASASATVANEGRTSSTCVTWSRVLIRSEAPTTAKPACFRWAEA